MKKIIPAVIMFFICSGSAYCQEYAIIKRSVFGSQKIEFYKTLDEALQDYSGEGTVYEIRKKKVPVKLVTKKKQIEVLEDKWVRDEKTRPKKKTKVGR